MDKEFHEIYEKYSTDLYAFILKMCGNEHLAKDILQDTMLKAMTSIDDFNEKCSIFRYCVFVNFIITLYCIYADL